MGTDPTPSTNLAAFAFALAVSREDHELAATVRLSHGDDQALLVEVVQMFLSAIENRSARAGSPINPAQEIERSIWYVAGLIPPREGSL